MKTVIIYLLAIFFSLNTLGLNTKLPLLAFVHLLGFAISLAARNVIRDLVNAFWCFAGRPVCHRRCD